MLVDTIFTFELFRLVDTTPIIMEVKNAIHFL